MKIYLVGGAVRDQLLGLPVKEKDYVVVGATVDQMLTLGFRQVGKDFPVFLHPDTHEEYALARLERKVGAGYKGFTFDTTASVTLEDDLVRRDLTINAMAQDEQGHLIDPYHGQQDLQARLLRHVSDAFKEDPVRILRVARFLARYYALGFRIAPETITLMQAMVAAGEVDALVAERVWKEMERALGEANPEQFLLALDACHALPRLFPTLKMQGQGMQALQQAAKLTTETKIRLAALFSDQTKEVIAQTATRYKWPNHFQELAKLTVMHAEKALQAQAASDEALLHLLNCLDVSRRFDRFCQFVMVCQSIANVQQQAFDSSWLLTAGQTVKSVDVKPLVAKGLGGQDFAAALQQLRLEALKSWRSSH